jgi:hypothetical protein
VVQNAVEHRRSEHGVANEGLVAAGMGRIQILDLALLIDGQHNGAAWGLYVEVDDILNLLGKGRVVGYLEGVKAMSRPRCPAGPAI